ncbi:hypothetical protein Ancab_021014 [Ancistrocladus abbreviatus]
MCPNAPMLDRIPWARVLDRFPWARVPHVLKCPISFLGLVCPKCLLARSLSLGLSTPRARCSISFLRPTSLCLITSLGPHALQAQVLDRFPRARVSYKPACSTAFLGLGFATSPCT